MTQAKKITIATVKSFINKNRKNLLIWVKTDFDGMVDGVRKTTQQDFVPAPQKTYYSLETGQYVAVTENCKNTLGINGVWFVGGSRDYCTAFETATHIGYEVSNCCGRWIVAITK